MPDRSEDQPDLNPARVATDPLLRRVAEMVATMNLYVGTYQVKQMTTPQKEMWADLVDAHHVLAAHEDPAAHLDADGQHSWEARWWRPGHPLTAGTGNLPRTFDDPRLADQTPEPDPFVYVESGGTRRREPVGPTDEYSPSPGAVSLARGATLDVFTDPEHLDRPWRHEDFAAVYEWAKRAVSPMRNTRSEMTSDSVFPSMHDARLFLAHYRAQRRGRERQAQ